MRIDTIRTLEEMKPFEAGWNEAVSQSTFDSVFSTYEWFSAWIRHFAEKHLKIIIAHEGNRLLGILPLMQDRKALRSLTNLQTFKFNIILSRQSAPRILRRMMDTVAQTIPWDSIQLDFVPDNSDPTAMFRNMGYRAFSENHMMSPYLEIAGSWEDYWARRSRNLRRTLSYKERRLEREGPLRVVRVENDSFLEEHVRTAFQIEKSSWKGKNGTAIACSEQDQGFYLELAREMSGKGRLLLYFLECRGRRIAFSYCLRYKNRINMLKTGYSPDYARYSPGMILQKRILQDLHEHHQQTFFDFLGARDEWKIRWTNRIQFLYRVSVFNNKIGPFLLYNALVARENCKNSLRRYPAAFEWLKRSRHLFESGGVHEAENRTAPIPDKRKN